MLKVKKEELLKITEKYEANLLRKFWGVFYSEGKYSTIVQKLRKEINSCSDKLTTKEAANLLQNLKKIKKEKLSENEKQICQEIKQCLDNFLRLEKNI
jgi:hypothetical protein